MNGVEFDWIAVDWGTTHLRVWFMSETGAVHHSAQSDKGMGGLRPDAFEPALLELIAAALPDNEDPIPVICCGMVGAKQGWAEAPYDTVPCPPPSADNAIRITAKDARLDVRILPGLCQITRPDVMRGEETQIAGYLARNPDFDGIICLPGTHTKWVQVAAGEIQAFATAMTGEMFSILSAHSILRHSVGAGHEQQPDWDEQAFVTAVEHAISSPATLTADLFSIRADGLLNPTSPAQSRARLSGLLLGSEIAGARRMWHGRDTILIGSSALCHRYEQALTGQDTRVGTTDGDGLTLAGLTAAYHSLREHNT